VTLEEAIAETIKMAEKAIEEGVFSEEQGRVFIKTISELKNI
jgi:hypothetical protein